MKGLVGFTLNTLKENNVSKYPLKVTTPASQTTPAVPVQEVMDFLREDRDSQTLLVESLIYAATETLEQRTGFNLLETAYTLYLSTWEDIKLPKNPYMENSVAITYTDVDGAEQTLTSDNYTVLDQEKPVKIEFKSQLPKLNSDAKYPVQIQYKTGFGTHSGSIPRNWKTAVKLLVMHFYQRGIPEEGAENLDPLSNKVLMSLIKKTSNFH